MFFKYKAIKNDGKPIKGLVEANSQKAAFNTLRSQSLFVTSLNPIGTSFFTNLNVKLKKISFTDIVHFTRQLSTMINAGLSLANSLNILTLQSSNPAFKTVIINILKDVEGGLPFSKALEKYPQHFSNIYISLVRSGEASGKLPDVLDRLAINLEKEREFKQKIKSALIYPIIIIIGMVGVMFIMMTFVIPKLTEIYKSFDAELPLNTLILIFISDIFVKYWWLMIILGIVGFFAFRAWQKTKTGALILDKISLNLPIWGELYKEIVLTEFTRTLGVLVGAGIPIIEALGIVTTSMASATYRNDLSQISQQVEKGLPLGVPMSQNPRFPPLLGQMVTVGEETGKMDETLLKLATFFETESEYGIKNLTAAMEPLIMVILGIGVGFIIISIILPIYNLTQSL